MTPTGLDEQQRERVGRLLYDLEDMEQVLLSLAELETPAELHQFAWNYNWDSGTSPLRWIVTSPLCDRGTALLVYWYGDPVWWCQYESREQVPETAREVYDLVKHIEVRYLANGFPRAEIRFDPGAEFDWNRVTLYKLTRLPIPRQMLEASPGEPLIRAIL